MRIKYLIDFLITTFYCLISLYLTHLVLNRFQEPEQRNILEFFTQETPSITELPNHSIVYHGENFYIKNKSPLSESGPWHILNIKTTDNIRCSYKFKPLTENELELEVAAQGTCSHTEGQVDFTLLMFDLKQDKSYQSLVHVSENRFELPDKKSGNTSGASEWFGLQQIHDILAVEPAQPTSFKTTQVTKENFTGGNNGWVLSNSLPLKGGESKILRFKIFAGPKSKSALNTSSFNRIESSIDLGYLSFVWRPLLSLVNAISNTIAKIINTNITESLAYSMIAILVLFQILSAGLSISEAATLVLQLVLFLGLYKLAYVIVEIHKGSMWWIQSLGEYDQSHLFTVLGYGFLSRSTALFMASDLISQVVQRKYNLLVTLIMCIFMEYTSPILVMLYSANLWCKTIKTVISAVRK